MKICFVSSECVPYAKTGGLADVSGALPKALAESGMEVKTFLPLYSSIQTEDYDLKPDISNQGIRIHMGRLSHDFNAWKGHLPNSKAEVYFIDCPTFYHRGELYTNQLDEAERFIFFQQAVLRILQNEHWAPDIIHCNDWQTALIPALLKMSYKWDALFKNTKSLLSIHNIGYQGRFSRDSIYGAGLPYKYYYPGGPFEFYDSFCFLKTGIMFADKISTVSQTYAKEIQTPEFGAALEGVLHDRKKDLLGILNGIDSSVWNPLSDKHIPQNYSFDSFLKKKKNKQALLDAFALPFDTKTPTIGIVSRLAIQKGFDIFKPVLEKILRNDVQFVILGTGEPEYEEFLQNMALKYPGKIAVTIGFNEGLAHQITAGADMFLMPSQYEPCGLNQMYSLNYGTVPIVRQTGGLADTVTDFTQFPTKGNGITFSEYTSDELFQAVERALKLFKNKQNWKKMVSRGMGEDFSWKASAAKYIKLYQQSKLIKQESESIKDKIYD
ncbi:MAG: glycogen synthase GlgA [Calditrichaeota bacterium]|nr:MAG: glycogen synthase GlgA [Calditrichota bacterium]